MTDADHTIVPRFLAQVQARPDATATIDDSGSLTYRQLAGAMLSAGEALGKLTDRPAVGIALPSCNAYPCSLLGVIAAGKTAVPLNLLVSPEIMRFVVEDSGIDTIITSVRLRDMFAGLVPKIVCVEEMTPQPTDTPPAPADADTPAMIIYTSGTMGRPKGAILTNGNLVRNVESALEQFDYGPDDVTLGVLPTFHVFSSVCTVLLPLLNGGSAVYQPRFVPKKVLAAIADHGITTMFAVPAMYRALARTPGAADIDASSLRYCISGGEALPESVAKGFNDTFGITLLQGYGMSETSPVIALHPGTSQSRGSVGPPLSWVGLRIVDDEGLEVPPGGDGELHVSGDCVMRGYHNNPDATAEAMAPGGWFRTGDIARLDENGYLYITGRKKELIISGGENISPVEIESVIARHPAVADVGVIGVSDETRGEVPKAFVELLPDAECVEKDILAHCRESLPRVKQPRSVVFISEMPRSPTGKVLRRLLREREAGGA